VIDLHAHILPGLDDGPFDLDEAAALARAAVECGTTVMATTSHINRGFGLSPEELAEARTQVRARLAQEGIDLELVQGGEVATGRFDDLDDETLHRLTLGDGPWVLLECPLSPVLVPMDDMVEDLHARGFEVLLAHPERSPSIQQEPRRLAAMVERGALAQVTAGSFCGAHGEVARSCAFDLLARGLVHVLASDTHHAEHRPPDLLIGLGELEHRFGPLREQVEWMGDALPAALLAGEEPPPRPPLPRPRPRERVRA
jgi:protein-tyrosine phosphatase